ncbi:MAG: hypothetical protein JRN39_04860 [Nitrososphaerota archaeon]|nr:hypothetical protein [Nitrososphaerota archaeon]
MVLAGKLFKAESSGLDQLFQKLEGFRVEKEDAETKMLLATEVKDLKADERSVSGRMLKDEVIRIRQKEEFKPILRTVGAPFSFRRLHDQTFLFVQEKKRRANELANDLSRILFMRPGAIVEARVKPEVMERYYESSFEDARIVFFDQVDIPNVEKLALYGSALADTDLYHEYLKHGRLWYIVVQSKTKGFIVGLTRNCVVTVFSQATESDLVEYVYEEVVPLTLEG